MMNVDSIDQIMQESVKRTRQVNSVQSSIDAHTGKNKLIIVIRSMCV